MAKRKIELMHDIFGECSGEICADCEHLLSYRHHNRRVHKCCIYGDTRSEASDWKVHYPACGLFPNEMPPGCVDVITLVRPDKKEEEQIEGQITLEEFASLLL